MLLRHAECNEQRSDNDDTVIASHCYIHIITNSFLPKFTDEEQTLQVYGCSKMDTVHTSRTSMVGLWKTLKLFC